jgi:carbonic anhydrase
MRLVEQIIAANHRAAEGDNSAGLHWADFEESLPLVALTCIDPRLNSLFPAVLGLPAEKFIWLRNAGNILTGPQSSTMRSLALACAIKQGKEIVIIGHTDCQVGKATMMQLLEHFKKAGIDRHNLPENLVEFFGLFASERQNVYKGVEIARSSSLLAPATPVHGMMVDTGTGRLDLVVNGYESIGLTHRVDMVEDAVTNTIGAAKSFVEVAMEQAKFAESQIGSVAQEIKEELKTVVTGAGIPLPPRIQAKGNPREPRRFRTKP